MSAVGSLGSTAVAVVYDPTAGSGYQMQVNGGVYRSNPTAANDNAIQSFRVAATGEMIVQTLAAAPVHAQGPAADNAPAAGNPVRAGAVHNSTLPTYADGDIASLQTDDRGRLIVISPTLETLVDGLEAATDGLETLIGTTNTTLTTLNGYADGLEALITATNGFVDGLEAKDFSTETTLAAMSAKLPDSKGQKNTAGSLSVTLSSDHGNLPVVIGRLDVVDFMDTPVRVTSSNNIAASGSSPTEVVASLAANVSAIQVFDTTGNYIGIYTGAAASEVLQAVAGPGMDGVIEVAMASGQRVSVRNMANTTISTGSFSINFLG